MEINANVALVLPAAAASAVREAEVSRPLRQVPVLLDLLNRLRLHLLQVAQQDDAVLFLGSI